MAPKSLILVGLLFAIVFVISSDVVVSARSEPSAVETKGAEVDGHHHHHCHHPHCREKENNGNDAHHEEEDKTEDGWHHHEHHHCHHPHC